MKARIPFRSLFTTTSVAALLVATTGAHADGTTVSEPTTNVVVVDSTDFVTIETTVSNSVGTDGLVITSTDVDGSVSVTADGSIDVSDFGGSTDELAGILVSDDADVGGIFNYGSILVDMDSEDGSRRVWGIRLEDGATASSVTNSGRIDVSAESSIVDADGTPSNPSLNASAQAFGIEWTGANNGFSNSGTIEVDADVRANFTAADDSDGGDAEAEAELGVSAYAAGASFFSEDGMSGGDFDRPSVVGDMENGEESITVAATAVGYVSAEAVTIDEMCGSGEEDCLFAGAATADAYGTVSAAAYGVRAVGQTAQTGSFENYGDIDVTANALIGGSATGTTTGGDAIALLGGHRNYYDEDFYYAEVNDVTALAVGVSLYADIVDGDVTNSGTIDATANAQGTGVATADGTSDVLAEIHLDGEATAKGVDIDTTLIRGGFTNDGRISATSNVNTNNYEGEDAVPIEATANGGDTAEALIRVYGGSQATGVEIDALSMDDDFYTTANGETDGIFATANVNSMASATAQATSNDSGDDWSYALVDASFSAHAVGIDVAVDDLSGHFVNEGPVGVVGEMNAHQIARAEGVDETAASADASLTAWSTGIRFGREGDGNDEDSARGRISGSFINKGIVTVTTEANSTSDAYAIGEGALMATAGAEVSAAGTGIYVDASEIQDNFRNEGDVSLEVLAQGKQNAFATVDSEDSGDAYAAAGDFFGSGSFFGEISAADVETTADGTGIELNIETIGGFIHNDADVDVNISALQTSEAQASSGESGVAAAIVGGSVSANSSGIYVAVGDAGTSLEWVDDQDVGDGAFTNDGEITSNAVGSYNLTAGARANDGSAFAIVEALGTNDLDDADASAWGIYIDSYDEDAHFAGSIVNNNTVSASAHLTAALNAEAIIDDGSEVDTAGNALAGGVFSASADGFSVFYADVDGSLQNESDISALAAVTTEVYAQVTSDDSLAFAVIGSDFIPVGEFEFGSEGTNFSAARARGLALGDSNFADGVTNDGLIGAQATVDGENHADAFGDETAVALIRTGSIVIATGIEGDDISVGGDFLNTGAVHAIAGSDITNLATSEGKTAYAHVGSGEDGEDGYTQIFVDGVDLSMTDGDLRFINQYNGEEYNDNEGAIQAGAFAHSENVADADALTSAEAVVIANDQAYVTGLSIDFESEDFTSYVENSGVIEVEAVAGTTSYDDQKAIANARNDMAGASATHLVEAYAEGVDVTANEFVNSGLILAESSANSRAYADATSDFDVASATAVAAANAETYGVIVAGVDESSTFTNSGLISSSAQATAYAKAIASGEEGENLTTSADASARARGLVLEEDSYFDTVTNELGGLIEVEAFAESGVLENEEAEAGDSTAYATGIEASDLQFATMQNDGEISATARAKYYARAYGIDFDVINDEATAGKLINTGTISASASSDDPWAKAIYFDDDESVAIDRISNTGTISATVFDYDSEDYTGEDGRAVAIDLEGAGNSVTIEQLDGAIIGDVLMESAYADYLEWSGGTITGNIYGDEGDDNLNVFAGADADFTYDGTVDGLGAFEINGDGYEDDVRLRLTNTVRDVTNFNVGPNATLNMGTQATVTTEDLNLDASSTLVFDLTSEGANGVINTTTADLGDATVKANFVSPWLPDSQVYRIINWDGDSETRFGSVVSSSLLEKVVAEYGEEGVDLLATRLQFADLTGLEDDATSFGHALDRIFDDIDPDSDLGEAIMLLIQLTPDQFAHEMSQIAGQQIADVQHVTLSQLGSLIHVIQTQINEARTNLARNAGGDGLKISFGSDKLRVSSDGDMPTMSGVAAGDDVAKGDWSAWARVFGDWSKLNASGTAQGFTSNTGGVVIGADYAISDALTLGLAGGYQTSKLEFGTGGEGDVDSWSVTAYGDYRFGDAYIDALVGYSLQSFDMDRYLTVLGTKYVGNSQYDGSSIIGAIEAGYTFTVAPQTTLTPFVGLNGNQTKTDASVETGAGIWNLAYGDRSETRIDTVLGARLSKSFVGSNGLAITPTFELGWKHGFGDDAPTANASLAGTPGTQFQIFGSPTSSDSAIVGAALQVEMSETVDLYVQYNGQYSSDYSDNTASLRLRWKF